LHSAKNVTRTILTYGAVRADSAKPLRLKLKFLSELKPIVCQTNKVGINAKRQPCRAGMSQDRMKVKNWCTRHGAAGGAAEWLAWRGPEPFPGFVIKRVTPSQDEVSYHDRTAD
jgi:hypothetical protein